MLCALLFPAAPNVFGPRLDMSIAVARKLFHDIRFGQREEWLQGLKQILSEQTDSKIASETGVGVALAYIVDLSTEVFILA